MRTARAEQRPGKASFSHEDLRRTAQQVVETTGEHEREHVKPGGWYSHSVLANALLTQTGFKLLFQKLDQTPYEAFMADDLVSGALVNQDNYHWIALVKHNGLLWEVDSRYAPAPLDKTGFSATLKRYPDTFAIVQQGYVYD